MKKTNNTISDWLDEHGDPEIRKQVEEEAKEMTTPILTCRYFIYVFYQVGNVGSRDVKTIDEQPNDGFESEQEAEHHLKKLIFAKKGPFFERNWYKFTIMKTWNSLSAI